MTIRVKCDGCGSVLKIKDDLAGKEGNCPKCKAVFTIPAASAAKTDEAAPRQDAASEEAPAASSTAVAAPDSDDDDIFGKDFFKLSDTPTKPKYTTPKFDEEEPVKAPPKKAAPEKPAAPAVPSSSTDAAADIAGKLLAKTGKKNKSNEQIEADLKAEQESEKLDLTEVKYMLSHQVLPIGGGVIVLVLGLYWLMSSMGDKVKYPDLGQVTGIVTVEGKTIPNAEVRFTPLPVNDKPGEVAKWSQSYGMTDGQGAYTLSYNKDLRGGVIGRNTAQVMVLGRPYEKIVEVKPGANDIPLAF